MSVSYDHIISQLESLSEEIADLGMARLRDVIEAGDSSGHEERQLGKARRAVEKAARDLRAI